MRLWLLLSPLLLGAVLAAGCSSPGSGDGFQPTCPAWTLGKSTTDVTQAFSDRFETRQRTDELGAAELSSGDHPLDRVELDFSWEKRQEQTVVRGIEVLNSTLFLSFFAADGTPLEAYEPGQPRAEAKHRLRYGPGAYSNFTLYVDLAAPEAEPDPQAVTVQWDWEDDLLPNTKGAAIARYIARLHFRTC